jgi:leucyl-tRNA---protein transferase
MLVLDRFRSEQADCVYLPGRPFHSENLVVGSLASEEYVRLLGRFWRRSGRILYRPTCSWCRQCVPLRVIVDEFVPTRSQARVLRKNADLRVVVTEPHVDLEHLALYGAYLGGKHGTAPEPERDGADALLQYWVFLVDSPVATLELQYWAGTELVGVGIVDDLGTAGSSVYFYYDLRHSWRSLGVYSMLVELEWARARGYRHHYLGYWVRDSPSMAYKSRYRPAEILVAEDRWQRLGPEAR